MYAYIIYGFTSPAFNRTSSGQQTRQGVQMSMNQRC